MQTRKISIKNSKGGVGKTVVAVNLAGALALAGHRVLAVDVDPGSRSLTDWFALPEPGHELIDPFLNGDDLSPFIARDVVPNLDILPSSQYLDDIANRLMGQAGAEAELKYALRDLKTADGQPFDYMIVDTPPTSTNFFFRSAMVATNECIIVVEPSISSIKATKAALAMIRRYQRNNEYPMIGAVCNKFRRTQTLSQEAAEFLRSMIWDQETEARAFPRVWTVPSSTSVERGPSAKVPLTHQRGLPDTGRSVVTSFKTIARDLTR